MNNPIEIGKELKKSYLQYIKAGLPLMEKYYEEERNKMYEEDDIIMQPPYIEIVKKYEGCKNLTEICKENGIDIRIANFLNRGLLYSGDDEERKLYRHQEKAIIDVIKNRKNMVITTGTGSGKTESFLIPLLVNIIKESISWREQSKVSALRSIIFYPLNALAEDQMVRLRKSLEREDVKKWFEENELQDRITFGRYTSRTPKNKSDDKYKEIKFRWDAVKNLINKPKNTSQLNKLKELIYSSPCCEADSAEIIDRDNIQKSPPDILITNYSMLNIMLMRSEEQSIFEKTRKWLSQDKENIFTLVIDELHTYRGTAGTEVAYIIKVLLHRLGLSPTSPQVRFLASSASMDSSAESQKYIFDFFGVDFSSFSVISDPKTDNVERHVLPPLPMQEFQEIANMSIENTCDDAIEKYFENNDKVTRFVKNHKLIDWLTYSLQNKESGNICAKSVKVIDNILFDKYNGNDEQLFTEIFLLLINKSKEKDGLYLQPLRAHYLLRNIEKIYMCINNDCDSVYSNFRAENRQYGKMYNTPITRCTCGSLVYEAIVCRHCGEMYFCGYIDEYEGKLINVPDNLNPSKPTVLYKPETRLYPEKEIDDWLNINFDCKTGKFKKERFGKYYQHVKKEESDFPTKCPRCEFSTSRFKTSDFSALFRHGTGVQKVNQVCADTIMQVLARANEARKLVIFSDSRQSAAKLSAGIELDHYRDVLRQTILTSVNSNSELIEYLTKWRNNDIKDYKDIPTDKRDAIQSNDYLDKIRRDIRDEKDGVSSPNKKTELDTKLKSSDSTLDNIMSVVMKKLINAGINPAGPYPSYAYVDLKDKSKKWHDCINNSFEDNTKAENIFVQEIEKACKLEILRVMLGNPKRSFESLGLGYWHVQIPIPDVSPEFLDSVLRILGESNRIYSYSEDIQKSLPNRLWKYFKAVKNETKTGKHPLLDKIKQEFVMKKLFQSENDYRLTGARIEFIQAKEGDNVWVCSMCNTKHLHHSDGKCTYCFSDLNAPEKLCLEETYYTQTREMDKLHCEELTGQTNTKDALDRQRLFQDIVYENENEKIDNIEILSVTTTMEAGVDIGPLSAVMMGNVPPQRFNYQQRVGRAGRRGNPLSIALTVSRASSHDQMHYANPERIVSGDPPPPYLDFSSKDIFKRIVYKELLRNAFADCVNDVSTNKSDSVHGQFGYVYDWDKNKPLISDWLNKQKNIPAEYSYLIGIFEDEKTKEEKKEILNKLPKEIISNIDKTINDPNFNQIYLSERLAAGGRLPMFGFPTQVRNLYESKPYKLPAENYTDRHMDLALATFAPGAEIVKDKKIYTSVGFIEFELKQGKVVPIDGLSKYENNVLYQCSDCWYTAVLVDENIQKCPICEHIFDKSKGEICQDICSPKGYCVNFDEPPKDFNGNFSWNPVKINSRLDSEITREIKLKPIDKTNLRIGNNQMPNKGVVRTINTNNGELFTVQKTEKNGWVVPDLVSLSRDPSKQRKIALVTTKITGVIIMSINDENRNICINPLDKGNIESINTMRAQLIKSAFLSWGELIRRAVSDYLDIRNNELSVDYSIRRDDKNTQPYSGIYMMELLENGAGYTDHLASLTCNKKHDVFIAPLLDKGNIYKSLINKHQEYCDTSCYDCLCDYFNQQKHGLLNWRLGLDIALLSDNNNYLPLYTTKDGYWPSILIKAEEIIKKNYPDTELVKEDTFWYTRFEDKINFIYHPLWSENYILEKSNKFDAQKYKINYISLLEFINNPL